MLDDYQELQPIIYQIMKNTIVNQKVSHAYLLDFKNCSFGNEMALSFVKYLLCPYHKTNFNNCGECIQCKKIDDLNYTELKIIDPSGIWIKKEQLDELQEEFSKKSLAGKYKIYIIHEVEKLNTSAANSLLKFLEEPEEGIIAILTTNNLFQVLETIRSRCQILSFASERRKCDDKTTISRLQHIVKMNSCSIASMDTDEKCIEFLKKIIEFIDSIERKGKETLLYTTKLWHNFVKEKEELVFAFEIMILFYSDVLNKKCNRNLEIFIEEENLIAFISEKNTINELSRKIKIIMEQKGKIKVNVNNGLLIDKLIISLVGGD